MRHPSRVYLALCLAVTVSACRRAEIPHGIPVGTAPAAPRVAHTGVVQVTGNEPLTHVQLMTTTQQVLTLDGPLLAELRAAAGLEIEIAGRPVGAAADRTLHVEHFVVRAADGTAAHDGVLRDSPQGVVLERVDRTRTLLPALPPALREQIGARIFWVGPLDRFPVAYGILRAAPRTECPGLVAPAVRSVSEQCGACLGGLTI
jgi:hypothetical protein